MEGTLAVGGVGIGVDNRRVQGDLEGTRMAYPVLVEAYRGSNQVAVAGMHLEVALDPRMDCPGGLQMERVQRRGYQH
jgi:hypothetical protein